MLNTVIYSALWRRKRRSYEFDAVFRVTKVRGLSGLVGFRIEKKGGGRRGEATARGTPGGVKQKEKIATYLYRSGIHT